MPHASDLPTDRLAIGQLLVRLLALFRADLLAGAADRYPDLRPPHLQIFGCLGVDGIRLTDLAAKTQLSLAAASEFVSELEQLGYVERRPDRADRRAKLIFPTRRGRSALNDAGDRVADIEQRWALVVGSRRFADACQVLQNILDEVSGAVPAE